MHKSLVLTATCTFVLLLTMSFAQATDFQDSGWQECINVTVNLTDGQSVLNALVFDVNVTGLTYSDISEIALSDAACMEDGNEIAYQIWDNSSAGVANGSKWVDLMWQESIITNTTYSVWYDKNTTHSPNTTEVASRFDLDSAPMTVSSISVFNCGNWNAIIKDLGQYTMFSVNGFGTSGVVCGWRFHHNDTTKMINFSTDDFNTQWYRGYTNNTAIANNGDVRTAIDYNIGTFINYMPSWTEWRRTNPVWQSYTNQSTQATDMIATQFMTQVNETFGAGTFRYLFLDEFLYCNDCNATDTVVAEVQLDTTPPTITIFSPTAGLYNITIHALDVGADEIIDTWWRQINSSTNVTFTPNTTVTLSEGTNVLDVWANDTANNIGHTQVIVDVDTDPPDIFFADPTPANGSTIGEDYVFINATADEEITICTLHFPLADYNMSIGINGTFCYYNVTDLNETHYWYYVSGYNNASNFNQSGQWEFYTDFTPPVIYVPNNISVNYQPYNVSITTSENADYCWWESQSVANTTMSGSGTSWYADLLPNASQGNFMIEFRCNDSVGNVGYNNSFWLTYDWTPPVVTVHSPENATEYTSTTVPLQFSSNEPIGTVKYSLNSGSNVTITDNTTVTAIEGINNTLVLWITDGVGNEGYANVDFTVGTYLDDRVMAGAILVAIALIFALANLALRLI